MFPYAEKEIQCLFSDSKQTGMSLLRVHGPKSSLLLGGMCAFCPTDVLGLAFLS